MPTDQIAQYAKLIIASLVGAIVLYNLIVFVARRFLYVCAPSEILVFSGSRNTMPDGSVAGFRVVTGGRCWRYPFIERVARMDRTTIPIEVGVTNAYSNGGIPLNVLAVANVKIASDPRYMLNAVERLLGRSRLEIQQIAKETLEGSLRGIVATMTPEQVNEDRLTFAERVADEAESDLAKLGIMLDTLKIQAVSDEVRYLDSIGRARIAELIKRAEIAESDARNEANKKAATAKAEGDIALANAEREIVSKRNEFMTLDAELKATVRATNATAEAAGAEARSKAEQELQEIRKDVERVRLQAEVVLPAEADREARELLAKGDAAPIQAQGEAVAKSLEVLVKAWAEAGPDAREISLLNQIESLTAAAVDAIGKLDIGETHLIDTGDGRSISGLVRAFPEAVSSVLASVQKSTGIDIPRILSRSMDGTPPPPAPEPPAKKKGGAH